MEKKFLIVGTGFSGAVLAHQLAISMPCKIDIIDERPHVGGNCYTEKDQQTGIMIHTYGPHIFNTNNKEVWDYVNRFIDLKPFINRVKARYRDTIYSLPINLHTINQLFEASYSPDEAKRFIESVSDKSIKDPKNFEEQALKFIGKELYYAFFYGYTKKQWGCEPSQLPAAILKRLPVRFNYNDNYYASQYQGIPVNGYTEMFEKLLDHPSIQVKLNTRFVRGMERGYDHLFYTGPIDAFFDYDEGRLSYRTVTFEKYVAKGDFQGNPVINYCEEKFAYTRIHEHKHFTPWEQFENTVYFKEFSKETLPGDVPYYPKRLHEDKVKLEKYRRRVEALKNISFLGRLATYRYMDMHHVIEESLKYADYFQECQSTNKRCLPFPNHE
jgi:UDP-galactopyranose mutase